MSVMKNLDMLLQDIIYEGIESGYSGEGLRDYVCDVATSSYRISRFIVKPYVDANVETSEKDIFDA